jgi:hypothetical protein
VQLLLRSTRNGRLPLTTHLVLKAINRIKTDEAVGSITGSIRDRIQRALDAEVYPALMAALHKPPIDGPSPRWAIRVISIVEDDMPVGNGHDLSQPLLGNRDLEEWREELENRISDLELIRTNVEKTTEEAYKLLIKLSEKLEGL